MNNIENIQKDCEKIWSKLLQEVQEKTATTRLIPNSLLVLGDERSGKSSLIARLQKSEIQDNVGLEFQFLDVKDEAIDVNNKLNVWIAPGDISQSNLIKYALEESNFCFTMCIVVASFDKPWSIIDSLKQWLDILRRHIDRLQLDPGQLTIYKESLFRHFQEYYDPCVENVALAGVGKRRDTTFNFLHPFTSEGFDKVFVPLAEEVLDSNLGIPIIIVMTKTDQMTSLEQKYQYDDDKFDFIQMHIRRLCLKYGAALCYTSIKDGRNCELLLRYILHRCYGFPFLDTASVIDKEAIFIPAGWDNGKKINILANNLPEENKYQDFHTFISKPLALIKATVQSRLNEPQLPEDEQIFLMKQQAELKRLLKNISNNNQRLNEDQRRPQVSNSTFPSSPGLGKNRKLVSSQSASVTNPGTEGDLQNFFNKLLTKRNEPMHPLLSHQYSTVSDPGKCTGNNSEIEDSLKEDRPIEVSGSTD